MSITLRDSIKKHGSVFDTLANKFGDEAEAARYLASEDQKSKILEEQILNMPLDMIMSLYQKSQRMHEMATIAKEGVRNTGVALEMFNVIEKTGGEDLITGTIQDGIIAALAIEKMADIAKAYAEHIEDEQVS